MESGDNAVSLDTTARIYAASKWLQREFCLRSAWRYDFEGDHAYAAIRRCIGLRHLYWQGRISREEFQALLPHNLRAECSHLPELPWPDADDEAWTDNVTHGWRQLPPDKQAWPEREFKSEMQRANLPVAETWASLSSVTARPRAPVVSLATGA